MSALPVIALAIACLLAWGLIALVFVASFCHAARMCDLAQGLAPDAAGVELDDEDIDAWEQEFACGETEEESWMRSAGVQW